MTLVENFLRMTFGLPAEPTRFETAEIVRALGPVAILPNADHEQELLAVDGAAALVAGQPVHLDLGCINALCGSAARRRHQAVLRCSRNPSTGRRDVHDFVKQVKNKATTSKLMGFSATGSTRTTPLRASVKESGRTEPLQAGRDDDLLAIGNALEEVALTDEYYRRTQAHPNVEFYTIHRCDLP